MLLVSLAGWQVLHLRLIWYFIWCIVKESGVLRSIGIILVGENSMRYVSMITLQGTEIVINITLCVIQCRSRLHLRLLADRSIRFIHPEMFPLPLQKGLTDLILHRFLYKLVQ